MAKRPATPIRMAARVGREHEALPHRRGTFNGMPLLWTCCYPPAWHEIYRQLLGQFNLLQRHFAGQGIAQPQNIFAIMPRRVRCCEVDPFMGENDILGDAEALIVHKPEQILAGRIALFGRPQIPVDGYIVGLRNAAAVGIHEAQNRLGMRVAA